jgi:hypothetical protein
VSECTSSGNTLTDVLGKMPRTARRNLPLTHKVITDSFSRYNQLALANVAT